MKGRNRSVSTSRRSGKVEDRRTHEENRARKNPFPLRGEEVSDGKNQDDDTDHNESDGGGEVDWKGPKKFSSRVDEVNKEEKGSTHIQSR